LLVAVAVALMAVAVVLVDSESAQDCPLLQVLLIQLLLVVAALEDWLLH
jgi:hypothetical protein